MRRSYSICSGVDERELRVAIKRVSGGLFSCYANDRCKAGDAIDVLTPEGRFHTPLAPPQAKHYAAFAAGSGITPVLSLIKTALRREPHSRFTLLYCNRRQSSVMFHEDLEDLKDRYIAASWCTISSAASIRTCRCSTAASTATRCAHFRYAAADREHRRGVPLRPGRHDRGGGVGAVGPGLPAEHIHVERFGVQQLERQHHVEPGDAPHALVTLMIDGVKREVEFRESDPSILDAALAAGLEVPYSCKGGMCCTCRAKVADGQVRMDKNYSLERRDLEAGFVLTCQSHPLTERVTLSYDDR